MAMTTKELELQKKAKLEEAKRLAKMQAGRDVLRNSNVTYGPTRRPEETVTRATRADVNAANVRTPQAVDGRLQTADVAAYRAAGQKLSDPNRTVADVQRAVAERVRRGNAIREATDFPLYQEALNRQAPPPAPPTYAGGELPPNVASMEERYQVQGIEPPSKASPSVRGFLNDMVQANDPRYLTRSAYDSKAVPNVVKAAIRFGENTIGAGARAFSENVAPAATRLNESLGNYAAGGEFAPNTPAGGQAQRLPDNMPPARFPEMAARLRGESPQGTTLLGNTGTPAGGGPAGGSAPTQPRSVAEQPFERMPDGSINLNSRLSAVDTSNYNENGTANNGIIGFPGGSAGSPLRQQPAGTSYGPRDATGRRTMTINRANPYAGMSDAAIAPIAEQKRQEIAARRLSGAAQGGNVLRQVQQLQNQAAKTFEQVRGATNNSKAAERAAGVYQDQANQLIEADRNQVFREGDVLRSQTDRYGIDARTQAGREAMQVDAAIAQAKTQQEADSTFQEWLKNYTSIPGKDGKPTEQPWLAARVTDMMGNYRGPDRTRVARALTGAEQVLERIREDTGRDYADISEVFDLKSDGTVSVRGGKIRDLWNVPGFDINELLSEWLPFGASGDVITGLKNGQTVELPKSVTEGVPLHPRLHQQIYGNQ